MTASMAIELSGSADGRPADVTIVGPVWDPSGYAETVRQVALGLERCGVRVRLEPHAWGSAPLHLEEACRRALEAMTKRPGGGGPVLFITIPENFHKIAGRRSIGWTMLETDRISAAWVDCCNAMDEIWVPTLFNRDTFTASGVNSAKVHVMPLGVDPVHLLDHGRRPPSPKSGRYTFLANGEWVPRKGFDILIRAYCETFSDSDCVTLIIKAFDNTRYEPAGQAIQAEIERIASRTAGDRAPRIDFVPAILSPQEMAALYAAADCYVLPTRGEGWNHPALEAAAHRLPIITTRWSGHLDFVHDGNSYLIPIDGFEAVPAFGGPNDRVYAGSRWAIPSLAGTKHLLRHVFEQRDEAARRGFRAHLTARRLTWQAALGRVMTRLCSPGPSDGTEGDV